MTCISITLKLTLSTIIYQVVLLASKPKVFMDENEFFDRKVLGIVLFKGLFELNVHKSLERALAFSK